MKQQKETETVTKRQELQEAKKVLSPDCSPAPHRTDKANQSRPASSMNAPALTPLISPSIIATHRLGPRPIAAVSNMLAIQKAKEKIDQMKAAKLRQQEQTIAHTVSKGSNRVAHVNKAIEPVVSSSLMPN